MPSHAGTVPGHDSPLEAEMTTDYGTAFPNSRKVYVTGRAGRHRR